MKFTIRTAELNKPRGKLLGFTTLDGKLIYIQHGLKKRKTFEVLIHEMTHAAMAQLQIKKSKAEHERIALKVGKYATKCVFKN